MDHVNPSSLENSENMITWGNNFDQNLLETKSFRCTFCKRGFSNAQALGGHMNIHRRDRAKLREFSSENLLSLDMPKNEEIPLPSGEREDDSDEKSVKVVENPVPELPFFDESPPEKGGHFDKQVEGMKVEGVKYGEVDLELRLGPEPHHAKSV